MEDDIDLDLDDLPLPNEDVCEFLGDGREVDEIGSLLAEIGIPELSPEALVAFAEFETGLIFDPADLQTLSLDALADESSDGASADADQPLSSPSAGTLTAGIDADTGHVVSPTELQSFLDASVDSYPDGSLPENLSFRYESAPSPEGVLGLANLETGAVELFDNADTIHETIHHELGHHVLMRDPELEGALYDAIVNSGYKPLSSELNLEGYPEDQLPAELCAEAIADYQNYGPRVRALYPSIAQLLDERFRA